MRLYLAVAVLMLAFVAYTEAQDADDGLAKITDRVTEFGRTVAETAKNHFETIKNSEFTQKTKNWFNERLEELQAHFSKS